MDKIDTAGTIAAFARAVELARDYEHCGGDAGAYVRQCVEMRSAWGVPNPPRLPAACHVPLAALEATCRATPTDVQRVAAATAAVGSAEARAARCNAMQWIASLSFDECIELVRTWLLGLTVNDCSIIITVQQQQEQGEAGNTCAPSVVVVGNLTFAYRVQVVDLGPKPVTKLTTHEADESTLYTEFAAAHATI